MSDIPKLATVLSQLQTALIQLGGDVEPIVRIELTARTAGALRVQADAYFSRDASYVLVTSSPNSIVQIVGVNLVGPDAQA